mmetsp:Transcript_66032/g.115551  ORF Transcript_66032/g.115551 Transcript_66032/m.115551 type:complete len:103 (-) Transcript_66032:1413-1721(-)
MPMAMLVVTLLVAPRSTCLMISQAMQASQQNGWESIVPTHGITPISVVHPIHKKAPGTGLIDGPTHDQVVIPVSVRDHFLHCWEKLLNPSSLIVGETLDMVG